jgi:PPOX class probable F420-dependent enzyme
MSRRGAAAINRIVDVQNRVLDRMRHRQAFEVSRRAGEASDFDGLRGARQCLVVSHRRSGEPVPTPVNFGLAGGRLYFRSEPRTAKVGRIRRDPRVKVCACNIRGKPSGRVVDGRARVLSGPEASEAETAVAANWSGPMKMLEHGLDRMVELVYVEVEAAPAEGGEEEAAGS